MCVSCLAICRTEGDRETILGWFLSQWSSGDWRDFLFWMSPTQSTPPTISAVIYLRTWPSAYPNPLPLLFSPFAVSLPPTPSLYSPSITPSYHHLSVCIPDSSTLLLFFCSLFPWFHLFPPPLLPLSSLLLFFFEPVSPHPKGEAWAWWTWRGRNKSVYRFVDVSLALPLWSSAENKVFIKRNLPNLLPYPLPFPSLSAPLSPLLVNGEPVSGTCPSSWDLSSNYISLAKSHLSGFLTSAFLHFLP